eukprot:Blabericola_migrator_1__6826@NODE_345_length_9575_cov_29_104544_g278_i0_p9_GENE_NODE_345_length_9575_cov_29_104544_g278_i0NODE_345_length_9575_cov_29_104544_g278_i0_p9_ORF_typecomplete_len107_score16_44DUF3648/PF12364_8/8_3e03DUF3648/PF12364_8/0_1_NODE_345_length_9575_cov_29_104544_g278_i029383258
MYFPVRFPSLWHQDRCHSLDQCGCELINSLSVLDHQIKELLVLVWDPLGDLSRVAQRLKDKAVSHKPLRLYVWSLNCTAQTPNQQVQCEVCTLPTCLVNDIFTVWI